MQSTFIKIKFTPLIRHLIKDNTKCCLEIMPNVSCIENLDKIQWDEENNLVEYNVPVTYKIILKRSTEDEDNKIYYSCIDLRHLSTNSTLACGDITRVISDNCIISKAITNYDNSIVLTESHKLNAIKSNESKTNLYKDILQSLEENVVKSAIVTGDTSKICLKASKKGEQNQIVNDIDAYSNHGCMDLIDNNKPVKQIFIENTISKETITEISDIKNNKKLKLMVTSICTFSTIDAASSEMIYKDNINNNSKICLKFNQINRVDYKSSQLNELFPINTLIYNEYNRSKMNKSKRKSFERILPNVRVAHFMRTVENEILPLKILLSEIYRKCASLGLLWKSDMLQKPHKFNPPKHTDKKECCYNKQKGPKCNRVVYSIVFEE